MIVDAGGEPVVEWGALYGDVWGLEVTRVNADDAGAWLEIGVGKQDRLVHRMMLGDEPPQKALTTVVNTVRTIRQEGELEHPLNQLARERWLRAWLVRNPDQINVRTFRAEVAKALASARSGGLREHPRRTTRSGTVQIG